MSALSIKGRIFAGVGLVLAICAALGAIGFLAVAELSSVLSAYRATSKQSLSLNAIAEDLFEARMAALNYRIAPSDAAAEELSGNIEEIFDQTRDTALFDGDAAARAMLSETAADAERFQSAFDRMRVLQAERDAHVARLGSVGQDTRQRLTRILETASRDGDADTALFAGRAQQELLLGRLYIERFLRTNASEAFETAGQRLAEAQRDVSKLLETLENAERRADATAAQQGIAAFLDTARAARTVIEERNAIRADQLDVIGPRVQARLETTLDAVVDEQNRVGSGAIDFALRTELNIALLAVGALVVGAGLAGWIGLGLSRAVNLTASRMERLAAGDMTVDIDADAQRHELGRMARALTVFKANAERVAAMAREKEDADAQAERQRRAMMAELKTSIGQVVDAAVAGDLSNRAPTTFPDAELNEIASGLNRLLEVAGEGVERTGAALERVAEGDLGARVEGAFSGAFATLQNSANATIERLSDLVRELDASAAKVRRNADSITDGAGQLSSRTEQQASSLEETAATIEELTSTVQSNAENARAANQLAADASHMAVEGGAVVGEAVEAMARIEKGAAEIADIIGVIDGIAFQTNLLALNAAVEAARAGEAGKGFAVVASEVRTLAQRSSEASQNIRGLIASSTGEVGAGVQLVRRAGASLDQIVAAIRSVEETIAQIASASSEQATGVAEMSQAISAMDGFTQQNAAIADQNASAARAMAQDAEKLDSLIAFFRSGRSEPTFQAMTG